MSTSSKLAFFVGGTLFGSVGLKLLTTKEAKKAYVYAAAIGLRAKDEAMKTVTAVTESANDILASAKELNAEYEAKKEKEAANNEICDVCECAEVIEDAKEQTEAL